MKPVTTVFFAALVFAGCVHRQVRIVTGRESDPVESAYQDGAPSDDDGSVYLEDDPGYSEEEGCEPAWDGHAWIEFSDHVHGPGCGHFYYHDCWNCYPEDHVYVEVGYGPCWETGGFIYDGDPWARVWDGCAFVFLRGHVHGRDCGHFYHDGCWNLFEKGHEFHDRGHHEFSMRPPARLFARESDRRGERGTGRGTRRETVLTPQDRYDSRRSGRAEAPQRPGKVEPGRTRRPGQPSKPDRPRRPEQPRKPDQPRRPEPPRKPDQPQRIEQPRKPEHPGRPDEPKKPERREQPPQHIEKRQPPPKHSEESGKSKQPEKRESPKQPDKPKKH